MDKLLLLVPWSRTELRKTVQSVLEAFDRKQDFDHVKCNILYSNAKADKSYAGFLNNALKGDWEHDRFYSQSAYEKFMRKKQMMENGHENLIAAGY